MADIQIQLPTDPYTAAILGTVQAVCGTITEVCKTLQTPEGQKAMAQMAADRAAWDKTWAGVGSSLGGLFKQLQNLFEKKGGQ